MKSLTFAIMLALLFIAVRVSAQDDGRTFKFDAIELQRGEQVEGSPDFAATHFGYSYLFRSAANRDLFAQHPEQYEIQFGGACARMGPLSGACSIEHFTVHEMKLYVFASPQCRKAFVAAPEKFLETDDPVPAPSDESAKRGRELIDLALRGLGGAEAVDSVKTYSEKLAGDQVSGDKTYRVTHEVTLSLPHSIREDACWDASCWAQAANQSQGWFSTSRGENAMHPAQYHIMCKERMRHVLSILRLRNEKGFIALAGEEKSITSAEGSLALETLIVSLHGAMTTLGIEPKTGHVRWMQFTGRGPNAEMGTIEKTFSKFHSIGALTLPSRIDVTFNGQPVTELSGTFESQSIDDPGHAAKFVRKSES
jgi:YHS domain-containing protein